VIGDHAVVGADMVTMVLPLPRERRLDWDPAAAAIRDLRLEVLWDTGDLSPWEYWLGEVENLPGAVPAFVALRAAQGELHGYACELRGAIEHGWPDELIALETPTRRRRHPGRGRRGVLVGTGSRLPRPRSALRRRLRTAPNRPAAVTARTRSTASVRSPDLPRSRSHP
jgi:hypothetical protein